MNTSSVSGMYSDTNIYASCKHKQTIMQWENIQIHMYTYVNHGYSINRLDSESDHEES